MARPTKTDNPRSSILDAARGLLLEQGYRQLSLRAVAGRAGFSPASLYEYFEGKEDLVAALAAQSLGRLRSAMQRAAEGVRAPDEALVAVGLAYVEFARQHREDFLLLFSSLESARGDLGEAVPEESPYALLAEWVRAHLEQGGRRASQRAVEQGAYAMWAAAHGMAMLQLSHLRGFSAEFAATDRMVLRALVKGLLAEP